MHRLILISALCVAPALSSLGCRERIIQRRSQTAFRAAQQAHDRGDDDQAIEHLIQATQQNPKLGQAHAMLGDLYREQGDLEKATVHYEAVAQLEPDIAENHYKLGVAYQLLNRVQEAAASYLRSLELNPTDAKTNMNLGLAYLALGRENDAELYLRCATELEPQSAEAWANYGVGLDRLSQFSKAETAYRTSLDLNPGQPSTLINLGTSLVRQQRPREAIAILERVVKEHDEPFARCSYAAALLQSGQLREAEDAYQQVLHERPNYYTAINGVASVRIAQYEKSMELDESLRRQAVELWIKSLQVRSNQLKVLEMLQKWDK